MIKLVPLLLAAIALAACGKQESLQPAAGRSLPQKPALAAAQPTVDDLLAQDAQSRPYRSDELLRQSEKRRQDRFDLPPQ